MREEICAGSEGARARRAMTRIIQSPIAPPIFQASAFHT
jgi:hypothetical protein